jgi:hypothetical protein
MFLQAPPPSKRRGLTASQWLYTEYLAAQKGHHDERMEAARGGIVSICKVACGLLRPHWFPPEPDGVHHPLSTFLADAWRDRRDFAEEFVDGELERGMNTKEARYIGRRCKLRLIDKIRSVTGFNKARDQRDQRFRDALKTLQPLSLQGVGWETVTEREMLRLWLVIRYSKTRHDASNTTIAGDWYRSEGWVRKLRKRLATRLWSIADGEQRKALTVLRLKPSVA